MVTAIWLHFASLQRALLQFELRLGNFDALYALYAFVHIC